jgi:hypothetical protein
MSEDHRRVLTGPQVLGILGPETSVDRKPGANAIGRGAAEVPDDAADQDSPPHRHNRRVELQVGHRPVLASRLPQVDQDRSGLPRLDPGQDPLEPLGHLTGRTPACGLEVGQEDHFLLIDRGDVQDAVDRLEGGREIDAPVGDRQLADLLLHLLQIGRGIADDHARRLPHENHANCITPTRFLDQLGRLNLGLVEPARPARGVPHAHRAVDDQYPMNAPAGDYHPERLEERLGHRRHDQQDDERPDGQQEPLLDPDAPLVLPDCRQEESHGRPGDFAKPTAVQQVENDRHGRGCKPVKQRGVRESQGPDHRWRHGHGRLHCSADAGRAGCQVAGQRDVEVLVGPKRDIVDVRQPAAFL